MGSSSSVPANVTCTICQTKCTNKKDRVRPSCCRSHFFHRECLVRWAKRKNTCPLDNKEFSEIVTSTGDRLIVQTRDSDDEESGNGLAALLAGALIAAASPRPGANSFKCSICDSSREEELAEPDVCDHKFHKSCLIEKMNADPHCPAQGCNRRVKKVHCHGGDVVEVGNELGVIRGLHAALTCPDNFKCSICNSGDDQTQERAKPNCCSTEFHRECLVEHAREDKPCPHCREEIKEIKCLFGDTLTVNNRSGSGENLFLANLLDMGFECKICEGNAPKERAKLLSCGHVFHWDCLSEYAKKDLNCPGCFKEFSQIQRQQGDTIVTCQQSALRSLVAAGAAPENFKCDLCNEAELTKERGKPSCCEHEFHRACLLEKLRKDQDASCPHCHEQVTEIQCTFGACLKVARKT